MILFSQNGDIAVKFQEIHVECTSSLAGTVYKIHHSTCLQGLSRLYLGEYQTLERLQFAISMLKSAIRKGDPSYTFPEDLPT